MHFASFSARTNPLIRDSNFLKFTDLVYTESCVFSFNKSSFSIFTNNFTLISTSHYPNTISANDDLLFISNYNIVRYGRN